MKSRNKKIFIYLMGISAGILLFQNCDPYHVNSDLSSSSQNGVPLGTTLEVDQDLQNQSLAILSAKCGICHDSVSSGGVTHILDVMHLISAGLVIPGDPSQGRLIQSIESGSMPIGGSVSPSELQTMKDWVSSMKFVDSSSPNPDPIPDPLPQDKEVRVELNLHNQAMEVLNVNCAGCHQGVSSGGPSNILDVNELTRSGLIVPGNSDEGRLLGAIHDGSMPKGNGARVTAADLGVLKNWIDAMVVVNKDSSLDPLPTRPSLTPTFTGVYSNIIQPKCLACHGPVKSHDGWSLNSYTAVKSRSSKLLAECQAGKMPESPYLKLSGEELTAFKTWVADGAPNN